MKLAVAALLLVLLGVASAEEESSFVKKVRTKRKLTVPSKIAPLENDIKDASPIVVPIKDEPVLEGGGPKDPLEEKPEIKEPVLGEKKTKLSEDVKELQPPQAELNEAEAAERKKKEACIQMGDCAADCNPAVAAAKAQQGPILVMKQAEPVMKYANVPTPQARTIDPIYSFGPVNVNAAHGGVGGGLGYHGATGYSGYSSGLYAAPEPMLAPASLQVHAVLPYASMTHHQRRPMVINHNMPEVVYYGAAAEPVYISSNGGQQAVHSSYQHSYQTVDDEPVSLYCQPMRSSDLVKALGDEKVVHEDKDKVKKGDDADMSKHIKKVNQIGEELSDLKHAAQKLVQQQDQLAKMQSEHLMRSVPVIPSNGMDPLYRHFEEQMRTRPMGMHGYHYGMRPMYRESEQPGESQKLTPPPNTATTPPPVDPQNQNAKTEKGSKASPTSGAQRQDGITFPDASKSETGVPVPPQTDSQRQYNPLLLPYQPFMVKSDEFQRQYPYFIPPMYKNDEYQRQYPYYSETGFYPHMFRNGYSNMASYPTSNEDVQFFRKLMDFGKRLGIDPYSPDQTVKGKSEEKEHKSEDAISDLMYGNKQKNGGDSQEVKNKSSDEEKPKTKRDHRELVMKKKE